MSKNSNKSWFDREHLKTDLKNKSIKGGVSTISAQAVMFCLNMGSTIILARLLVPEDYGLVAMVTAVTGFVVILKDMGLSQALIQNNDLNQWKANSVFWLNLLIAGLIALLILGLAPILVYFYEEPKVLGITIAYSVVTVISALSMQHGALLRRQMQFNIVSKINIIASVGSIAIGVVMGYLDYGFWAIVAISVMNSFITMVLVWVYCSWRPSRPYISRGIGDIVKFGVDLTGFNVINYFARNLDNVIIGKFLGTAQLGLYSKAYQLLMLPITQLRNPLMNVGIPAMSSLEGNSDSFKRYYLQYVFLLSFFSMPIVAFMGVCAPSIIQIVLGSQWSEASPIFQLLAIVAFVQPVLSTRGLVLIATGESRRYLHWGLINSVTMVIAFFVGIQWGLNGLIIGYTIGNYVLLIPSLIFCYKGTQIRVLHFMKEVVFPTVFSLLAMVITYLVYQEVIGWGHILAIVTCLPIFAIGYLLPWIATQGSREKITRIKDLILGVINKKRKNL